MGEISPAVPNIINRNFKASNPNEKLLTDITEFHIKNDKVYLSPMMTVLMAMLNHGPLDYLQMLILSIQCSKIQLQSYTKMKNQSFIAIEEHTIDGRNG